MRIALLGTRGVPANYGGFETCAEELALGLLERGHDVTVYCRHGNAPGDPTDFRGVRLVYRPEIRSKSLATITHTFASLLHALRQDFDVLMVFNAGNAPLCVMTRVLRKRVAINVDGLEWKRKKWGRLAKLYYQFGEWTATKFADRIISDSRKIQDYYEERFHTPSTFIAYGADIEGSVAPEVLREYGLEPREYFFVASRLEPENNGDLTVEAFKSVRTTKKLVFAGGANWDSPYIKMMKATDDPRVVFLGPVYAPGHIRELTTNSYGYVHANEVGGTGPALLKALGYGTCVLALGVNFNEEVVQDAGLLFRKDPRDLAEKLQLLIDDPELAEMYRQRGPERIKEAYQWPAIVDDYERLFERIRDGYYKRNQSSD